MHVVLTTLPTLTVSAVYCLWTAYRALSCQRERKLRERVAYLLWITATEVE